MNTEERKEKDALERRDRYAMVISVFDQFTDETLLRIGLSRLTGSDVKEYVGAVWREEWRSSQLEKQEWAEFVEKLQDGPGIAM